MDMTFRLLMSEHTLLTIHYFESLFRGNSNETRTVATETRGKWLFSQIDLWIPYFGPEWKKILSEHTQLAAEAGLKVFQDADPSPSIKCLFENMNAVVAHLQSFKYSSDQVRNHWTRHLNCTVKYLTALRKDGYASPSYQTAKRECVDFATQFGAYLDGVDSCPLSSSALAAVTIPGASVTLGGTNTTTTTSSNTNDPHSDIIF